jgi:hypothetical protein
VDFNKSDLLSCITKDEMYEGNSTKDIKIKLNTLTNDVLGVEHSIDNIHNYDDTNIKENLKEITDQINNVHTEINNITANN